MCYVFDSLEENFLLHKGDSIALMVPIFTPYIEIPELTRYDYDVLNIPASTLNEEGLHTWQYKVEDINKLQRHEIQSLVYCQSKQSTQLSVEQRMRRCPERRSNTLESQSDDYNR